jgi:hypothetical protein
MQGFAVDLDELDRYRRIVQDHAERFRNIGSGLTANDVNESSFGTLRAATELARVSQDLHAAVRAQCAAAEGFLSNVGRGVSDVSERTNQTEVSNTVALRALARV